MEQRKESFHLLKVAEKFIKKKFLNLSPKIQTNKNKTLNVDQAL